MISSLRFRSMHVKSIVKAFVDGLIDNDKRTLFETKMAEIDALFLTKSISLRGRRPKGRERERRSARSVEGSDAEGSQAKNC